MPLFHDERCLCGECEVSREKQSHDAEIERIADALGMDTSSQTPTIEEIVDNIRILRFHSKKLAEVMAKRIGS